MKITVTVSKTVQERQYEPTGVSLTWEENLPDHVTRDEMEVASQAMYHQMSDLVDQLLFERTGRKVRRQ